MRAVLAAPVIASVLIVGGPSARALSLGQVNTASRLGQALDFAVVVRLDPDEAIEPSCARAEVKAGDNPLPASQVRTRWLRARSVQETVARVETTVRLSEPVVTITLSLGCPPRFSHQFVTLLDPPLAKAPTRSPGSAASTARTSTGGTSAAAASIAGTSTSGTSTSGPRRSVEPAAPSASAAASASQAEPAPALAVLAPLLAVASAMTAASAAEPQPAVQDARAELEERLEQQRLALQSTQDALAAVQQRLREAELARRTDPTLYALVALVVMLLGVVGVLLWRLARLENQRAWLHEARMLAEGSGVQAVATAPVTTGTMPLYDEATLTSMRVIEAPSRSPASAQAPAVGEAGSVAASATARARRSLSADELVDLEQQADFFIVLGQEEAAIDLLMSHVRSSGGASPMPYLKLLDIYRRRGDADAYDRIRERFNRRFNGQAPRWEVDPAGVRDLLAYPDTVAQLQAVWSAPSRALELLEALLFRRDSSPETFELHAYEELLLLYAVARDVFEREVSPDGVDLLLPLGTQEPPAIVHAEVTQRLDANVRTRAPEVDLELDLHRPSR